jgi:hypothetical protein
MLITFASELPAQGGVREERAEVRVRTQACPVCGNVLVPLRGFARCGRCSYTLCQGCEGGQVGPEVCETE